MARAKTKEELMESSDSKFKELLELIESFSEDELNIEFDFSNDIKKTEAHWDRDKNLRDILIHLYEWHQLLLNWVKSNSQGIDAPFLLEPYNWRTYGEMNIDFWKKHQDTSLSTAKGILIQSHSEVMPLIDSFSDEELFSKKVYKWTGTTTLGSYCVSSTSSHYEWAIKKIKAHKKQMKNNK